MCPREEWFELEPEGLDWLDPIAKREDLSLNPGLQSWRKFRSVTIYFLDTKIV